MPTVGHKTSFLIPSAIFFGLHLGKKRKDLAIFFPHWLSYHVQALDYSTRSMMAAEPCSHWISRYSSEFVKKQMKKNKFTQADETSCWEKKEKKRGGGMTKGMVGFWLWRRRKTLQARNIAEGNNLSGGGGMIRLIHFYSSDLRVYDALDDTKSRTFFFPN